jgi:hypothetical protein
MLKTPASRGNQLKACPGNSLPQIDKVGAHCD